MRILTILMIAVALFATACECVPGLDTPKKIEPDNSAKITLLNCLSDSVSISMSSNSLELFKNISFNNTDAEYQTTYSDENFVQISKSSKSVIFSGIVNLKKNSSNTLIAHNLSNRARLMSIEDSISQLAATDAAMRMVNLSAGSRTLQLIINNEEPIELKFRAFTEIKVMPALVANIEIIDAESNNQLIKMNLPLHAGRITNIVLISGEDGETNRLKIVRTNIIKY